MPEARPVFATDVIEIRNLDNATELRVNVNDVPIFVSMLNALDAKDKES